MRLHRDPQGEALEGAKARDGYTLYQQLCSSCHSAGLEGVPQLDQPSQWEGRREQGIDALYRNTLEGIGDMPARGLCDNCSDEEIRGAVEFMLKKLDVQRVKAP